MEFTPEQQEVIDLREKNILVSAAAGSGKTAVLVERILGLITDEKRPVDIDHLLIVTFTNAAAGEMRERIGAAIEKRLELEPDNEHLQKQSTLLHRALITTIDSFCLFILKNNFNDIGLDPGFRVADTGEVELLKQDIINDMFEELLDTEETSKEFVWLLDHLAIRGKEKVLEETILKIYQYSQSFPWPKEWLLERYKDYDIQGGMEQTLWGKLWKEELKRTLSELESRIWFAMEACKKSDGPYMYLDALESDLEILSFLKAKEWREQYEKLQNLTFARLSTKKDPMVSSQGREMVKILRDQIKKEIGKLKENFFPITRQTMEEQMQEIRKVEKVLIDSVIRFSEKFEKCKRDKNILDFNDMEHMALDILISRVQDPNTGEMICEPTRTAIDYSCYFKEIMIDEYQDSNLVQEYLLQSISGEKNQCYNRFMVGDLKQSIYKFRLARPDIFLEKYHTYSLTMGGHSKRIDLHKNFRSRKQVLDSVNHIFYQIMDKELGDIDYTEEEALFPGADYEEAGEDYRTELLLLEESEEESRKAEGAMIASRIQELVGCFMITDKETGQLRPTRYKDIVILLRSNAGWDEEFQQVMLEYDIPTCLTRKTGYFSSLEIQTILSFLRTLDNPKQDIPLYATMKSLFGNFTEEEIVSIKGMGEKKLYDNLILKAATENGKKEKAFLERLNSYRDMVYVIPIHKLIRVYLKETGYLHYYAGLAGGEQRTANIKMLLQKAESYEKTSYFGLFHFIRYMEQLKKYEIDVGESGSVEETGDMVRIMSIHKSKGLEFPICFVAGLGKKINQQDTYAGLLCDMDLGIGMEYRNPIKRVRQADLRRNVLARKMQLDNLGEELRILYVAMTRAKEKLIMTGMVKDYEKRMLSYEWLRNIKKQKLPFGVLSSANSYLDFILPAMVREQEVIHIISWNPWHAKRKTDTEEVKVQVNRILIEERLVSPYTKEEQEIAEIIRQNLSFAYAHPQLQGLYVKTSVSELKMKAMEEKDQEAYQLFEEAPTKDYVPEFVEAKGKVGGTIRGNAYHRVMELMDFTKIEDLDFIMDQMKQQAEEKVLDPLYVSLIKRTKIQKFLESTLAKRMKKAQEQDKLYREQPFVYGLAANRLDEKFPSEEKVLIQGIVDVFFEEEGELVIVDYKTDAVETAEELCNRYREQLKYYQEALECLTEKTVKEKILYSFALNQSIVVN
ncbi:MAG: helicase-exonuclease AddAB subunit AddA [Lachnospiraceae bacterium]|nr:helicase-exonuclease AddAB subunit AddA [Lachnospiraceae bacterium]